METINVRRKIIDAGIRRQESIVSDFLERIDGILATEGNVNEEEYDNHTQSFKAERIAEVNLLNDELQFATKELEELRKMEGFGEHKHDTVEYGSVVRTDKFTFFVSASLEEFSVDGMRLFGLSVNSPLYQAMKGKRVGDTFTHGDQAYVILEIF